MLKFLVIKLMLKVVIKLKHQQKHNINVLYLKLKKLGQDMIQHFGSGNV